MTSYSNSQISSHIATLNILKNHPNSFNAKRFMLNGIFVCEDMKYLILEGFKGFTVKVF